MKTILSREAIAQQADQAAADWVAQPTRAKPANPFDPIEAPDAHKQWRCSFERSLLVHSTGESSA